MIKWIEWTGGECLVHADARVHYRMKNQHEDRGLIGSVGGTRAGSLRWSRDNSAGDILAYRVVSG